MLLALGCFTAPALGATSLGDYTVYGENGVHVGVDTQISGLVGARNGGLTGGYAINLNGGASTAINGDARSGNNVRLQNNAKITNTLIRPAASTLTLGAGASVGNDVLGDPDLPAWPGSVASLTCPTGGADQTGANGESRTVTPGSYGNFTFGSSFELTFDGAGDYYFNSITTANGADVKITTPGVRVFVCGKVDFGGVETMGATKPSDLYVEAHGAGSNAFVAGGGSHWTGDIFTPNGTIHFGSGGSTGSINGSIWGDQIDLEHAVIVKSATTKSGTKFNDVNGNGQRDQGEPGLSGWTFFVDYNDNGTLDQGEPSDVSDANGYYLISGINAGTWKVREVQQPNWTCTYPGTKDAFSCYYEVTFADGDHHVDNDFGNHQTSNTCIPKPGEDQNCQPIVKCVPGPGQDANCQPIVTPTCVPKAGQDKNCNPLVVNSARLRGPSGCVSSSSVRVTGSNIRKVTFKYNGKRKTVKKSPFRLKIKKKQLKPGANRITATVQFKDGKRQTQRLTVQRCGSNAVSPQFTG